MVVLRDLKLAHTLVGLLDFVMDNLMVARMVD